MAEISKFDLISGRNIRFENVCTLKQNTLEAIKTIGYDTYNGYLNLILIDIDTLVETMKIKDEFYALQSAAQYKTFDLFITNPALRGSFLEALSFFVCEKLVFDNDTMSFLSFDDKENVCGVINRDSFEIIKDGICQINFLDRKTEPTPQKFKNSKAKEIFEKILKGRKEAAKSKPSDKNMYLPNIISKISSFHSTYNLLNIWSLTLYQVYDQFFGLNLKIQLDGSLTKWAAWGKEEFDFSLWYRDMNNK